jgi:hypothetical protein
MKHLPIVFMLLLLVSYPLLAGTITKTVTFSEQDLVFTQTNGYDVVELRGYPSLIHPGSPRVPRVVIPLCIPPGTSPTKVEIINQEVVDIHGTYSLYPAQPDIPLPMPDKSFIPEEEIPPNPVIYSSNNLYPEVEIKVNGAGTKSGYRIAHIEMFPLRYRPKDGRLQLATTITFRVEYTYDPNTNTTVLTSRQQKVFGEAVSRIVKNPEDLSSFAPRVNDRKPPTFLPAGYYEYVIITEDPMDTVFQRFADWKTRKGIPATVVTVSWITSNYSSYDTQEEIRDFIIDAYNEWGTIYVLCGGSGDQISSGQDPVPDRRVWYTTVSGGEIDQIPSDLYYSDLDGDWDWDGDHTYGEVGDNVDMYADVFVGRASVYNVSMAQNFVYKTLTYEQDPPPVYIKKLMLPTGILWSSYEERPMQDSIADMVPGDWQVSKMYERNGNLSRQGMIDTMNVGYQLGHWEGHGDENGIYYNGGSTPFLTSGDADGLVNGDRVGIANSIACFCGAWDFVSGGDCFAEHLVNRVGGGLCAVMMNSRYGWGAYVSGYVPGPSERIDTTFYYNIFYNQIYNLGETHAVAKDAWVFYADSGNQYDMTRWCIYELNLLGCPEMQIWTDTPDYMDVTHNSTIPMGTTNFNVTVREDDGITPIPNALVCLMGNTDTGLYGTGYTNGSGNVSINVTASIPNDTMWVTATAHNHYPYQGYALVLDAGMPEIPTIIKPLDFARLPDLQPELQFYSTDPQSDNLQYCVLWDTDPGFSSPQSETTIVYASGQTVTFTFPSPLTDGETYWWKINCIDPGGSGIWTQYSEPRSLTIGTSLQANTCSWFQTTSAQFNFDIFNGTVIEGDSILLVASGGSITDTLFEEDFQSGMPSGWTVVDGNSDGHEWEVGTCSAIGSYAPPNNGGSYAYYDDDAAGSGVINYNEEIISPAIFIPSHAETLFVQYGFGLRQWESGEILDVRARFFNGSWGGWSTVASHTTGLSGTNTVNLTSYLPADSVQVEWMYHDESSASHWSYACGCDNILVTYKYAFSNDMGTITGTGVQFGELSTTYPRTNWGNVNWSKADAGDSIGIQVEYYNGASWQLVPDGDLPGNSTGFFTSSGNGSVNLSSLDTLTYDELRLVGNFYRKTTDNPNDPSMLDWEVGNLTTGEAVPPEPFSLISPTDSTVTSNLRPTFFWEATVDTGSGLMEYRLYIESILSYTGLDTFWAADYDLDEGYNDWYVIAYDSLYNSRYSNETWTIIVDTTGPSQVNLISPPNSGYLNNSTVNFVWHAASDNLAGVDHYVLQYALDSGFSSGLVETTIVDTTFTTVLPDTTYYWHVRAVDAVSNSGSYSVTWQFELDTQAPTVPNLNTPINGVWLTNTSVNFNWTTVTFGDYSERDRNKFLDETKRDPDSYPLAAPVRYILEVDTNTSFASPVYVDTYTTNSANVVLSEDYYYWRVRAYDLAGNQGSYSAYEDFGVDATPPSTPTLVSPGNNSYVNVSTFDLVWNSATDNLSGIDYYVLQYALDSGFSSGLVETTLTDTTCTVTLPDTTYYWHVQAVDVATNSGSFSSTWQFELDTQAPTTPILNSPIGGVWLTNTSVDFDWSVVTFAQKSKDPGSQPLAAPVRYIFEVDTTTSFTSPIVIDTFTTNSTSIVLSEDFYYWRVMAYDLAGNQGSYSSYESFGVDVTAPVIDSTTVWTDTSFVGPFEIQTKVTDNLSGLDSVLLYYMRDEDPDWMVEVMNQSGDWFIDTIPAVTLGNDTVRYYIRALDVATNESTDPAGAPGAHYEFIANMLGIAEGEEIPSEFDFRVQTFSREKATFMFTLPAKNRISLKIYDVSGRIVCEPISGRYAAGRYQVLFRPHRRGVYFYKLDSRYLSTTGKLVIF